MTDVRDEYFRELLSRSFFQPSTSSNSLQFIMHDLINDLAQSVTRDTCFRLEDKKDVDLKNARHSSYLQGYVDGIKKFETFYEAKHLWTFLPFSLQKSASCFFELLPKLRRLRVLGLSRHNMEELPSSIRELKHLRYLNLSDNLFKRLSDSLGTLYDLQTLILRGCHNLKKLPMGMGMLINLRHLDITGVNLLEEMSLEIGNLVSLQTLSNFTVVKDREFQIRDLENLNHLGGTLCISGLQNMVAPGEARLNDKHGLDVLSMVWTQSLDDLRNERGETEGLDMLRPHKKLKELYIKGYHGTRFSTWIGDPQFSNMGRISVQNCKNCTSSPPLGQLPSLKDLYIEGMNAIKHVRSEFYGQGSAKPFPLLVSLSFVNMPEWEDLSTFGDNKEVQPFTSVSELSVRECPKLLGKLPSDLPCLKTLNITKCPQLLIEVTSLFLPLLTSLHMIDAPLPSLPMLLEMRNTLESSSLTSLEMEDLAIPNPSLADEDMLANAICLSL